MDQKEAESRLLQGIATWWAAWRRGTLSNEEAKTAFETLAARMRRTCGPEPSPDIYSAFAEARRSLIAEGLLPHEEHSPPKRAWCGPLCAAVLGVLLGVTVVSIVLLPDDTHPSPGETKAQTPQPFDGLSRPTTVIDPSVGSTPPAEHAEATPDGSHENHRASEGGLHGSPASASDAARNEHAVAPPTKPPDLASSPEFLLVDTKLCEKAACPLRGRTLVPLQGKWRHVTLRHHEGSAGPEDEVVYYARSQDGSEGWYPLNIWPRQTRKLLAEMLAAEQEKEKAAAELAEKANGLASDVNQLSDGMRRLRESLDRLGEALEGCSPGSK